MITERIALNEIRFFSSLIKDYVAEKDSLKALYHRLPNIGNFKAQLTEKQHYFTPEARARLVNALNDQYNGITTSQKVLENIALLRQDTTFTITTGHQLSLFTGPLYFIYKIVSAINTARLLTEAYPDYQFVPMYWMASEDHDFEEINHFHHQQTLRWHSSQSGMTGNFRTDTLREVFETFSKLLTDGHKAQKLKTLFSESYLKHKKLSDATRELVNTLFQQYGLVIIDGNHRELKKAFIPQMKNDLLRHHAFEKVSETIDDIHKINKNYRIQVNPREVNLFYLTKNGRDRIVATGAGFEVHQTGLTFTHEALLTELEEAPERFSPNVILRPLYQEVILPNLAYIGGGGEIAYWLELKRFFQSEGVPFPILMLRNSALLVSGQQQRKLEKLQLLAQDLFLKTEDLRTQKTRELSDFPIDFSPQRVVLQQQFADLYRLAEKTDVTFKNAVKAQESKQLKGLHQLEKRLLKAQKRNLANQLERIARLQNELFPNGSLQERFANFSSFYLEQGDALIPLLLDSFDPFDTRFLVLTY
ncbi:bacillithiol biosynthesis cysteine-adding enzyme BshC [Capnocytophaga sp.]|uniref:bacillithiol biosynthesis cysteine-adding enzyme BshC n=1 Tax=Capnocytophaga sp. TaxID=44737 RepID=UPI0026DB24FC|nr:bacillithiol biosynthesis cysteine-adding enzyme BshC [Capnocytophaga sp.]MDO5104619.1 bacillithiol biosynthesis cysteine-adding enzyme BshC [Capnocytophaga sp.]